MRFGDFTLEGFSLGGVETAVWVPEWGVAFDVGRGPRDLLRCPHLALTHTHMDHAGGLAYLLALRQLYRMKTATVYCPAQVADALDAQLRSWQPLQRYELDYRLVPVEAGARYPLRRDLWLEPFRTYHPVPSFGYTVVESRSKLRPDLVGLSGPEIAARRRAGEDVSVMIERRRLSVTGDTLPEVLDKQPHVLESETLLIECTFLDGRKRLVDARAGGHVHLDELAPHAPRFANQRLVLSHFSQIYKPDEIPALLGPFAAAIAPQLFALPTLPGEAIVPVPPAAA